MAWYFYDNNGNLLQVTGAHTLASHTGTLAVTAGGTGATSATAAASALGVGTEDSPEFTGINVGHASDTTITRASAGDIAVEGSTIYRAGGTDVPVADGGTGVSALADKSVLISQDSGTDTVGTVDLTTSGELVIGGSSGPTGATISGGTNITVTNGDGTISIGQTTAGVGLGMVIALGG